MRRHPTRAPSQALVVPIGQGMQRTAQASPANDGPCINAASVRGARSASLRTVGAVTGPRLVNWNNLAPGRRPDDVALVRAGPTDLGKEVAAQQGAALS